MLTIRWKWEEIEEIWIERGGKEEGEREREKTKDSMEKGARKNRYREIKNIKDERIVLLSKNRYQLCYDGSFIYYGLKNVGRVIPSQTANGLTEPILTSLHLARGYDKLIAFI